MALIKNNKCYREIPFCCKTIVNDFYTYVDLKEINERFKKPFGTIFKCRTLGILHSSNGRYYLSDFNASGTSSELLVQVSVVYMKAPPPSTVIPYPVQIIGTLQWMSRPVLFVKLLQALETRMAIRLKNALSSISLLHTATNSSSDDDDIEEIENSE